MTFGKALMLVVLIVVNSLGGVGAVAASSPPLSERAMGNPDAPVTMIEYASLTCDHCKRFHLEIMLRLKAAYIDTGKVKLAYRHFPFDQEGLTAAILAECAPRSQFFGLI